MIDHLSLPLQDLEQGMDFYLKALEPLDIYLIFQFPHTVALGKWGKPAFWLSQAKGPSQPIHLAFAAETREQVDQFYDAALAAGGRDNGRPGIREDYHPNYYGAFILDPDGNNIEAVCHRAE